MFTDMRLSAEGANTFRNYLNRHGVSLFALPDCGLSRNLDADFPQQLPFELSVSVLTASYWPQPIVIASPLSLPPTLSSATVAFSKYYDSRHSGRRLTWQGSLGTADVKVRFRARSHDVSLSTHALVVLLLFEDVKDGESLPYSVGRRLAVCLFLSEEKLI
jgi:cullin 3